MNIKKKLFSFLKYKIILMYFNSMDIIFMKLCTILLELLWSVNIWTLDATLSIFLEKESSSKFSGLKKNLKK